MGDLEKITLESVDDGTTIVYDIADKEARDRITSLSTRTKTDLDTAIDSLRTEVTQKLNSTITSVGNTVSTSEASVDKKLSDAIESVDSKNSEHTTQVQALITNQNNTFSTDMATHEQKMQALLDKAKEVVNASDTEALGTEIIAARTSGYTSTKSGTLGDRIDSDLTSMKSYVDDSLKHAASINDPVYYGADPTGESDSTDAINQCIANAKGNVVFAHGGVYRVTSTIVVPANSSLSGIDFNGSIIQDTTRESYHYLWTELSNVTELDCSILVTAPIGNSSKSFYIRNLILVTATNGIVIGSNTKYSEYPSEYKFVISNTTDLSLVSIENSAIYETHSVTTSTLSEAQLYGIISDATTTSVSNTSIIHNTGSDYDHDAGIMASGFVQASSLVITGYNIAIACTSLQVSNSIFKSIKWYDRSICLLLHDLLRMPVTFFNMSFPNGTIDINENTVAGTYNKVSVVATNCYASGYNSFILVSSNSTYAEVSADSIYVTRGEISNSFAVVAQSGTSIINSIALSNITVDVTSSAEYSSRLLDLSSLPNYGLLGPFVPSVKTSNICIVDSYGVQDDGHWSDIGNSISSDTQSYVGNSYSTMLDSSLGYWYRICYVILVNKLNKYGFRVLYNYNGTSVSDVVSISIDSSTGEVTILSNSKYLNFGISKLGSGTKNSKYDSISDEYISDLWGTYSFWIQPRSSLNESISSVVILPTSAARVVPLMHNLVKPSSSTSSYVTESQPDIVNGAASILSVTLDLTNNTATREDAATHLTAGKQFDNFGPYKRRRCIVTYDGTILAYYGDEGYTDTGALTQSVTVGNTTYSSGTKVQTMVYQPKFWYKITNLTSSSGSGTTKIKLSVAGFDPSTIGLTGYEVHPAFRPYGTQETVNDYILLSAYPTSVDSDGKFRSCIADAETKASITNLESSENHVSSSEYLMNLYTLSATQILFAVEYASLNAVSKIGYATEASGATSMPVGITSSLGNSSGTATDSAGNTAVSYRGEENLWNGCAVGYTYLSHAVIGPRSSSVPVSTTLDPSDVVLASNCPGDSMPAMTASKFSEDTTSLTSTSLHWQTLVLTNASTGYLSSFARSYLVSSDGESYADSDTPSPVLMPFSTSGSSSDLVGGSIICQSRTTTYFPIVINGSSGSIANLVSYRFNVTNSTTATYTARLVRYEKLD